MAEALADRGRADAVVDELATAEPKRLRHRLLHIAGRVVHHGRRTRLRLQADWPWATALVAAFRRLRAIPALC